MKYKLIYEYSDLSENPYITEDRDKKIAEKFRTSLDVANSLIIHEIQDDDYFDQTTFNVSDNFAVEELVRIDGIEPDNLIGVLGVSVSTGYEMWFYFCIETTNSLLLYRNYCESDYWAVKMSRMKPIKYEGTLTDTKEILIEYIKNH